MADQVTVHEKGFTVLYEDSCPVIDVVCVHGFTGHPKDTWTWKSKKRAATTSVLQPGESVYWPADLACRTIPASRILTYGYDTNLRHWLKGPVSKKTAYDHAWDLLCTLEALRRNPNERHRPILFVAHSLGGIVVKEALRRSQGCVSTKAHLYGIFEAVVGVMFFGTPHRGADPRNFFHHLLSASAQLFGVRVNTQIVNTLMPYAERLAELGDEFPVMCHRRRWQIFSFQEEYGDKMLFGSKVVDDYSSCLDNPILETKQHISRNHVDMCRFSGFQDPEYSKVAAAMEFILRTIETRADTMNPTDMRVEEEHTTRSTFQQPPSLLQPPPAGRTALLDPKITNALEIEVFAIPSLGFLLFMDRLPTESHTDIAAVIFSNCQAAYFNFYQLHGLHRTKFGYDDSAYAPKLFQLDNPRNPKRFPRTADDFSLEVWTSKFVQAHDRIGHSDTIRPSYLNDYEYSTHVFKQISKITNLVDAWGKVKIDMVEECLVYSLALCQVLKGWNSLDRLKALWTAIHRPELPSIDRAILMPSLSVLPPARDDSPTVDEAEDRRPSKRSRITVEEDSDQSGGMIDGTDKASETTGTSERSEESDVDDA